MVSIVIPVYNAEKYIAQALESILNQTYTDLEILIADDASTDLSRQIIDLYSDPRIKRYHNESNFGYLKTCNKLFELATGDYIAFQDADDWSELTRIEKTIGFLSRNPEIAICGCNFIRTKQPLSKGISTSNYPEADSDIKQYIQNNKSVPFCGATVVLKKSVYKSIGGYRIFFDRIGYEDLDWFLLMSEKYKLANIPDKLYYYRYVASSASRIHMVSNYKKYYLSEIAWFLREQRIKQGNDALQNDSLKPEFDTYLSSLEQKFNANRISVYKRLISSSFYNKDYRTAIDLFKNGIKEKEVNSFSLTTFFTIKSIKALIKSIVK